MSKQANIKILSALKEFLIKGVYDKLHILPINRTRMTRMKQIITDKNQ